MRYPNGNDGAAGEQVDFDYLPQMALNGLSGDYTYVQNSVYDALGRMTQRTLGHMLSVNRVQADYSYFDWSDANKQGGRLQQMLSGTSSVPDSLQDLRYDYDRNGNILHIYDYKTGSPQTQTLWFSLISKPGYCTIGI